MRKNEKKHVLVAGIAFVLGVSTIVSSAKYFKPGPVFEFIECTAQAADINDWTKEWGELQKQMEDEALPVLKKEIEFGNEDVSDEEKSTTIKSYDISNAIPMWTLSSDVTMISDYHKNNDSLLELIEWNNRWYIPATTMTGEYASILLQKEKDGYHVYGQYFGNDDNYIADTADEIKNKIEKELSDMKIAKIRNISIPFYKVNLVYIKQADGKERVIPYQAENAMTLNDIGEKKGTIYSVSEFISDMENKYEEYSEQELKQIIEKNKAEMNLGGNLQPKKRISVEKDNSQNDFFKYYIIIAIAIVVALGGLLGVKFVVRRKK